MYESSPAGTRRGEVLIAISYNTDIFPVRFWTNVTQQLHSEYHDVQLIENSFNSSYVDSFDGLSTYVDLGFMKSYAPLENGTCPTLLQISNSLKAASKLWFAVATLGFNNSNDINQQLSVISKDN